MKFSVFVVSLNAGEDLVNTVKSVLRQQDVELEVIIKDGMSNDGSLDAIPEDERIQIHVQKDTGIYDAMNQAIGYGTGDCGIFMNCGDRFYEDDTLKKVGDFITSYIKTAPDVPTLFYGDCYTANRGYRLSYPDVFNDYVCFTKTLCHQSTVYPMSLLKSRPFSSDFRMAADAEYYVHAYKNGYTLKHIPEVIAYYQGNGASETEENRKVSMEEGRRIFKTYFSPEEYKKLRRMTLLRGRGIKRFLFKQGWFYPIYSKCAMVYYRFIKRK